MYCLEDVYVLSTLAFYATYYLKYLSKLLQQIYTNDSSPASAA